MNIHVASGLCYALPQCHEAPLAWSSLRQSVGVRPKMGLMFTTREYDLVHPADDQASSIFAIRLACCCIALARDPVGFG